MEISKFLNFPQARDILRIYKDAKVFFDAFSGDGDLSMQNGRKIGVKNKMMRNYLLNQIANLGLKDWNIEKIAHIFLLKSDAKLEEKDILQIKNFVGSFVEKFRCLDDDIFYCAACGSLNFIDRARRNPDLSEFKSALDQGSKLLESLRFLDEKKPELSAETQKNIDDIFQFYQKKTHPEFLELSSALKHFSSAFGVSKTKNFKIDSVKKPIIPHRLKKKVKALRDRIGKAPDLICNYQGREFYREQDGNIVTGLDFKNLSSFVGQCLSEIVQKFRDNLQIKMADDLEVETENESESEIENVDNGFKDVDPDLARLLSKMKGFEKEIYSNSKNSQKESLAPEIYKFLLESLPEISNYICENSLLSTSCYNIEPIFDSGKYHGFFLYFADEDLGDEDQEQEKYAFLFRFQGDQLDHGVNVDNFDSMFTVLETMVGFVEDCFDIDSIVADESLYALKKERSSNRQDHYGEENSRAKKEAVDSQKSLPHRSFNASEAKAARGSADDLFRV